MTIYNIIRRCRQPGRAVLSAAFIFTKTSLAGLGLGLLLGAQAANASKSEWSTAVLMQKLAEVKEAELTFVEQRSSAFLVDEVLLTGSMTYRAPDFIEKQVETPYTQRIEINGDRLSIEKITDRGESNTQHYSLTSSESLRTMVEGFRATLAGNLAILSDSYDIDLQGKMSEWSVILTPKKPELLDHIEKIALHGKNGQIDLIETFNADGDESRLTLSYQTTK